MDIILQAGGLIEKAEDGVAELIAEGAKQRLYAEVSQLARLADDLAVLRRRLPLRSPAPPPAAGFDETRASGPEAKDQKATVEQATAPRKGRRGDTTYPRFVRDGDRLVKIGWSKRNGSEYEHKAHVGVVQSFCQTLAAKISNGKSFVMDDLFPMVDHELHEIPDYQAYLVLAWLRDRDVARKKGRDEYVLTDPARITSRFDNEWNGTPIR